MIPSRSMIAAFALLLGVVGAGCGDEIGDECSISADCSAQGNRICDISSPGGYCTIIGCDYNTCPEESVCVRFFSVTDSNRMCDPRDEDIGTDDCTADEICTLTGTCVPRNAELRYCMRTCGGNGDCRDGYECRDEELMRENGGEPVPPPGEALGDDLTSFCASAPFEG